MNKLISPATGAVLMLAMCVIVQAESATRSRESVRLTKSEQRMVDAINEYRENRDLPPLKVDSTLMRVARHAAPTFSHVVDGKWSWQRAHQAGFEGHATDNIANGYPTPEDAVEGWATSDGHAHQMRGYFKMNGRWCNYHFNRVGVGICGRKYVAVFGCETSKEKRYEVAKPVEHTENQRSEK